jgi:hypothetical protein
MPALEEAIDERFEMAPALVAIFQRERSVSGMAPIPSLAPARAPSLAASTAAPMLWEPARCVATGSAFALAVVDPSSRAPYFAPAGPVTLFISASQPP